jgi:hypothetical protein
VSARQCRLYLVTEPIVMMNVTAMTMPMLLCVRLVLDWHCQPYRPIALIREPWARVLARYYRPRLIFTPAASTRALALPRPERLRCRVTARRRAMAVLRESVGARVGL